MFSYWHNLEKKFRDIIFSPLLKWLHDKSRIWDRKFLNLKIKKNLYMDMYYWISRSTQCIMPIVQTLTGFFDMFQVIASEQGRIFKSLNKNQTLIISWILINSWKGLSKVIETFQKSDNGRCSSFAFTGRPYLGYVISISSKNALSSQKYLNHMKFQFLQKMPYGLKNI